MKTQARAQTTSSRAKLLREVKSRYRNRLRRCRLRAEIPSQAELARRSGIDRTTVSHLESNRLFLSIHYALRLKEVLGCPLDDLYEEVPSEGAEAKSGESKDK